VANAYLDMLNATPAEQAALQQIAQLRAAGYTDAQIFGSNGMPGVASPGALTLGGGYGFLGPQTDLAGITANYNLGKFDRGLALSQFAGSPYNIVQALDAYARSGSGMPVNNPVLQNIQPWYPSGDVVNNVGLGQPVLGGGPAPTPATGVGMSAGGATATGQGTGPLAGLQPLAGITDPNVIAALHQIAAQRQNAAPAQTAIQGGSRLLGQAVTGIGMGNAGFKNILNSGRVPGFGSMTEADMNKLDTNQLGGYLGLVGSTGNVADPVAALQDYRRRYSRGGLTLGSVGY
jgi:hypothetical protein